MEQGENWAPGSERATTGWKDLLVEGRIRIRRESNKERDNEGRSARETEAGARVCVSSLRGAREQPPPHRGEGEDGAKLQNIVSHRSACKLAGIYLIRGQSAYIRVCRLEGEKNARGKKGRVKDARRASRRSSSFFFFSFPFLFLSFFFFILPTRHLDCLAFLGFEDNSVRGSDIIYSRELGFLFFWRLIRIRAEEIRISWPTQLLSPARVNGDLRFVSIRGRVQVQERLCV